ncbi:hypothetical protein BSKO_09176 [Bryopsis sp. KO-2023]|nr:hypothetical protein BSKO_09176 [Bryopsis sp. KO-2023]
MKAAHEFTLTEFACILILYGVAFVLLKYWEDTLEVIVTLFHAIVVWPIRMVAKLLLWMIGFTEAQWFNYQQLQEYKESLHELNPSIWQLRWDANRSTYC